MAEALRLPRMSDTMEEGVIADVNLTVGEFVNTGDVVAEVETDKATMEMESFQEGTVLYVAAKKGDSIPVNGIMAILGEEGEDFQAILDAESTVSAPVEEVVEEKVEAPIAAPVQAAPVQESITTVNGRVKASPLAKKIASDNGLDLSTVRGSGEEGRIVKKDVEAALSNPSAPIASSATTPQITLPTIVAEESFSEVKVSQMRKVIAKRLGESKFQAPHFYLTIEVNMNNAIKARKAMNEISASKISFNDLIIKASASALRKHPAVNSSWLGDKIRYNNHIHIGMAIAVEEGLVVPVIKFADNKQLSHIAVESKGFVIKAKTKKLLPDEMQGNTFSISNLGMMGISEFTAIVNPPDAAILAVGGMKKELAFDENKNVVENTIMKMTLSCDHRVVDGAVGS
ncbi:MAG: pyruvate dehydrogenase E2 component (dihydrolipoamide acetyltransferase), partial [Planctomycetota bacterium]